MIKKPAFQTSLICLLLFIAFTGCKSNRTFDRQKWSYGDGLDFPLRDNVVDDLIKNHQLKGLNYLQVIDSLGAPQKRDTLQVSYQVINTSDEYNRKKPIHIKNLVLYFSKDSIVTRAEIYEHTNKK